MKIKSIKKLGIQQEAQHELVLKGHRAYVVVEGSLFDCDPKARRYAQSLFCPLTYDPDEIGMLTLTGNQHFYRFMEKVGANSKLNRLDEQVFQTVMSDHPSTRSLKPKLIRTFQDFDRSRIGVVVNALGEDLKLVTTKKQQLESIGYDCMVCFVNAPLTSVKKRNTLLMENQVHELWKNTQQNISAYSELFGGNMVVVDGSSKRRMKAILEGAVSTFLLEPTHNTAGQGWERKVTLLKRS